MVTVLEPTQTKDPLAFEYFGGLQRSPEWYRLKRGRIGSSSLDRWLAVSKSKTGVGKPLKARLDYEKELMFERQFDTSFETYVNSAMQDGIDYEDFGRKQYTIITGRTCNECGGWYNDFFFASPDRTVGDDGLLEIKIVKDNTFTDILVNGVPDKHYKQIQGQLWASGRKWCDYVAVNFSTKKVIIIRVEPNTEMHEYLAESVQEKLVQEEFALTNVYDIKGELPAGADNWGNEENDNGSESWDK